MAYLISEEAQDLLQDVKNFCDKEVVEQCKEYDVSGEWPKAIYEKAIEQGYQALEVPEEYGGPGLSRVDVAAPVSYTHLRYLELHIEQGKVLEEYQTEVGIVGTVAGPIRYRVYLRGMAEHSGATPMDMRSDALCAAAEIILELEKIGKQESAYQSVATVGVIQNYPNVLNVIPGRVEIGVDMRGIDQDKMCIRDRNSTERL